MNLKVIFLSMRPPFLVLTFVCVLLGASTVIANQSELNVSLLALALFGALLAHISVNTLNEYFDFKSGLDLETIRTQFSGGSGALPQNPEMAGTVLVTGAISSISLLLIGIFFAMNSAVDIIPVGIAGLVLIATYTSWINKHPLICLVAPGVGFGFLMVAGTQLVLLGEYMRLSWLVAVIPFFLVNNLLLLNQYPDIQADKNAGRNHFPIAFGIERSTLVYGVFAFATAISIIAYVVTGLLPMQSLIALIPMPLAFFSLSGAIKHGATIGNHPQYLAANVAVTILMILFLAISLIVGR